MTAQRAVVLLSGGLDSATTLAIAKRKGFELFALSFDYGQRHAIEIAAAKRTAQSLGAREHRMIKIDLRVFGGSALTTEIDVPKQSEAQSQVSPGGGGIPITYVPARNTIFLSYALAWAEVLGGRDIFIGVNALDYSGYPDCRPEFIEQFERLANLATKAGVSGERFQIHAPLVEMTKAEIIRKGVELDVDFSLTHSCYDPAADGTACGKCDSCQLRLKGFRDAGIEDPIRYTSDPAARKLSGSKDPAAIP
jgi:7-cyano-7-deazaguanine synthase